MPLVFIALEIILSLYDSTRTNKENLKLTLVKKTRMVIFCCSKSVTRKFREGSRRQNNVDIMTKSYTFHNKIIWFERNTIIKRSFHMVVNVSSK